MTSNVGQNYPYTSESEAERSARVAKLVAEREGLAEKIMAEATPVDRTTGGGSGSARRRAARASSTSRGTRSRSTPCSSSATAPAARPSFADPGMIDPGGWTLRAARRQLVLDGLGIMVSAAGFGFVYGLAARTDAHFSPIEAMAMSLIVFAGAAQFAAVGYVAERPRVAGHRAADRAPQRAPRPLLRGARPVVPRPIVRSSAPSWPTS